MTTFVDKVLLVDGALSSASIRHAFGGAIALAYAVASPRATDDIDVNITVPVGEASKVLDALSGYIAPDGGAAASAAVHGQVRVRWIGDRTPIDLFFPQHAFHQAVADGARTVPFAGRRIPVISPSHLTVFKALFNRPKDWPDIQAMLSAGSVDVAEALAWLDVLVGPFDELRTRVAELAVAAEGAGTPDEMQRPPVDWRSPGS